MKQCNDCQQFKELTEFHLCGKYKENVYFRGECKECSKHYKKSEKFKKWQKEYRSSDEYKEKRRSYRKQSHVKAKESAYEKRDGVVQKRRTRKAKRHLERYHLDPLYKASVLCRNRIREVLKNKSWTKINKFKDYIGCSQEELKLHIENLFQSGMTWENQGKFGWHIDHIIPLSSANTPEELYKLCHYTNLQPLWAIDNLKKSDKIL